MALIFAELLCFRSAAVERDFLRAMMGSSGEKNKANGLTMQYELRC